MAGTYSTLIHAEAQAANGLTATAALAGQNHPASADKLFLKAGRPTVVGLGMTSDTKAAGCKLVPDNTRAGAGIFGPGSIDFIGSGFNFAMRKWPKRLFDDDKITGYTDNTNVNEGTLLATELVYGDYVIPNPKRYAEVFYPIVHITSTADITFNNAAAGLDTLIQEYANLIDPDANYEIFGGGPTSGQLATVGGIFTIKNLSGNWQNEQPGILVNSLGALGDVNAGSPWYTCPYPIPVSGNQFDTVTGGMCSVSAGAVKFMLGIGRL